MAKSRFSDDSIKSPVVAVITASNPTRAPIAGFKSKRYLKARYPPRAVKIIEPIRPSQDFFGEMVGTIGCLPINTPTRYPKVSLHPVKMIKVKTCAMPFDGRAKRIAKLIKNGKYTSEKVEALALLTNPCGPFLSNPIKIHTNEIAVVIANPLMPPNQVAIVIATVLSKSER